MGAAYNVWFSEAEALPLNNYGNPAYGTVVADGTASGGQSVELINAIRYGPYMALPPGNYLLISRLKASNVSVIANYVNLDVFSGTKGLFASRRTSSTQFVGANEWTTISLPFSVPSDTTDLEVRTTNLINSTAFQVFEDYVMIVPDTMGVRGGHGSHEFAVPASDPTISSCFTSYGCGGSCSAAMQCFLTCPKRWCQSLGMGFVGGTASECSSTRYDIQCF